MLLDLIWTTKGKHRLADSIVFKHKAYGILAYNLFLKSKAQIGFKEIPEQCSWVHFHSTCKIKASFEQN